MYRTPHKITPPNVATDDNTSPRSENLIPTWKLAENMLQRDQRFLCATELEPASGLMIWTAGGIGVCRRYLVLVVGVPVI